MKKKRTVRGKVIGAMAAGCVVIAAFGMAAIGCGNDPSGPAEESPIKAVKAIGFMDKDGPKVKAVALEYDETIAKTAVSADDYTVKLYDPLKYDYMGNGKIGDVTKIYVNSEPNVSESGGTDSGKYVILEMFTDYLYADEQQYLYTLSVKVSQDKDITLSDGTVINGNSAEATNLVDKKVTAESFIMPDLDGFKFYTDDAGMFGADGAAWEVKNCFNQQDGLYYDENLSYALYVPEDYHDDGEYALVTLENPAANKGTHPMVSLLTTRSPAYYATKGQEVVKEAHGLDGLIVVVPVVTERVNDNGGTPAEYEALVSLWDHLIDTYSINTDYIYGSGQSVGGMVLLETQRNRDNFFAGLLLYEDQWAQNYYIDTLFIRDMVADAKAAVTTTMHYPRTDANITWNYYYDTEENKVYEGHDPYNYYYLISDDNIMILNRKDNNLSMNTWSELKYLYSDLTGKTINEIDIDAKSELSSQETALKNGVVANGTDVNINWVVLDGGTNGYSCRKIDATYEWLLTQTRQTEVAREKLDINKPFELAETQDTSDARKLYFKDADGNALYYKTAKSGAGTQFYNTCWLNLKTVADAAPGWVPDGMTLGNISGANIKSVQVVDSKTVAIEYDVDMKGLVANLKGDKIMGFNSNEYRTDIQIELDPFEFYSGTSKINCSITNIYVNGTAEKTAGAARCSGEGNYIIVELDADISNIDAIIQRTTLRTNTYIANAYPWAVEL